ncbi:prepilin-type N-terminal cleavage/methylation domain-containing protein [Candidatus Roizmanbacteria bacterium]|nr:prepilin-type N-terminal cleavage/methylation domain-containing protein [Candidatus Roizmanbacteria bacterium]
MINYFKTLKQKGFTLIELLIVIALLGALAAGLLAATDPLEQIKKGGDTSIRTQAETLYHAHINFYAQRNTFPTAYGTAPNYIASAATGGLVNSAISELALAGELKTDFTTLAGTAKLAQILVTMTGASANPIVCYQPQSKAFRNDQYTKYDSAGGTQPTSTCPNGTATVCYQCFR